MYRIRFGDQDGDVTGGWFPLSLAGTLHSGFTPADGMEEDARDQNGACLQMTRATKGDAYRPLKQHGALECSSHIKGGWRAHQQQLPYMILYTHGSIGQVSFIRRYLS